MIETTEHKVCDFCKINSTKDKIVVKSINLLITIGERYVETIAEICVDCEKNLKEAEVISEDRIDLTSIDLGSLAFGFISLYIHKGDKDAGT